MTWPHLREVVTVCDVLDDGACLDGVIEALCGEHPKIATDDPRDSPDRQRVSVAGMRDGYGYGHGYGDGYGHGNGHGDGYGYGYDYGYRDGYGHGYGYGYGNDNGNGDGDGYGDGGEADA